MRVDEFESRVLELEEIVIRIRAPIETEVEDYDFRRQASAHTSLSSWLETRVYPRTGNYQVSVIDGRLQHPHGRTSLQRVRESYELL